MSSKNERPDRRARAEQMRKERERAAKRRRNGITVGIVVVVVVLIAAAGFGIYQATDDNAAAGSTPSGATEDGGFVVDQKTLTGESSSDKQPVDVVIYEDFQCPGCRAFETSTRTVVDQLIKNGTIEVEYRPLDFIDQNMGGQTEYSIKSANAAVCVYEEAGAKAFYELHKPLFDNQMEEGGPGFTDQQYKDFASDVGADGVSSCISDRPYADFIQDTTRAFAKEGYNSTPTILINGEELEGQTKDGQSLLPTAQEFQTAVEKAANS
ncbi:DsbA family protein [Nocardioidaceae bacterium SCSIO 66511]|nr:DsbA family protein [Nocardioidaceae bacterium SCSIO 66511]